MSDMWVGVLGARSLVGECLLRRLAEDGFRVCALSRTAPAHDGGPVVWRQPDAAALDSLGKIEFWICVAPIWVLPGYFDLLDRVGARRVVALSSTSRYTKTDSADPAEVATAARLAQGEDRLRAWAGSQGRASVILRPTLIYGLGRDKNIAEIARFIQRFGFFPLFGRARGLRQPVHVEDVAQACVAALQRATASNNDYNLSGAEVLEYREMVARVFRALGRRPRLLVVPLWVFRAALVLMRVFPRYGHWSAAMAARMNRDLVFEHTGAARDLAFAPKCFELSAKELPA